MNIFKYLSYLASIMGIILIVYLVYLFNFPRNAAEASTQPFVVITKTVHPGDSLKYIPAICKYTNSPGIITRQLTGTEYRFLGTEPSNLPKGCNDSIVRNIQLPVDLEPGKYKVLITVVYELNFIRKETYNWETEEFLVLPPINE